MLLREMQFLKGQPKVMYKHEIHQYWTNVIKFFYANI